MPDSRDWATRPREAYGAWVVEGRNDGLYHDPWGHKWSSPAPDPDARCANGCGTNPVNSPQRECPNRDVGSTVYEDDLRWSECARELGVIWDDDLKRLRDKFMEYGSADLIIMGKAMESLLPNGHLLDRESRDRAGIEMALGFYALGKASRLFGAWGKGREPAEDTWHDLQIYALMARYVRRFGRWI